MRRVLVSQIPMGHGSDVCRPPRVDKDEGSLTRCPAIVWALLQKGILNDLPKLYKADGDRGRTVLGLKVKSMQLESLPSLP